MRGIVVSTPISISSGGAFSISGGLDPQLLRIWTLFWDRLDHPDSNVIGFGNGPDEDFLISEGVLQRSKVVWEGGLSNGDTFLKPHMKAYRALDEQQPGVWALASGPNALQIPNADQEAGRGFFVKLMGALPVPNEDVPLAELLEFKRKRQSELDELHFHINGIYQNVLGAPDRPMAEHESVAALSRAVANQLAVSMESGLKLRLTDLVSNFDFVGGVAGWQAASMAGMNVQSCTISAIAGAGIGMGLTSALKSRKVPGSPFGYIVNYHKNLFHSAVIR